MESCSLVVVVVGDWRVFSPKMPKKLFFHTLAVLDFVDEASLQGL